MNELLRIRLDSLLKNSRHIPYDEHLGDTSNPDYIGPAGIAALVDEIMNVVEENVTDAVHPNDYNEICAYCSRPAMEKYG